MNVERVNKGKCIYCDKKASRKINGELFCDLCGDGLLIKTIRRCIDNIVTARLNFSILPKKALKEVQSGKKKGVRKT
jgi:hypothetical protein